MAHTRHKGNGFFLIYLNTGILDCGVEGALGVYFSALEFFIFFLPNFGRCPLDQSELQSCIISHHHLGQLVELAYFICTWAQFWIWTRTLYIGALLHFWLCALSIVFYGASRFWTLSCLLLSPFGWIALEDHWMESRIIYSFGFPYGQDQLEAHGP